MTDKSYIIITLLIYVAIYSFDNFIVTGSQICSSDDTVFGNFIQIPSIPESLPEGSVIKKFRFTNATEIILRAIHPPNITFDNITQEFKVKQAFNITGTTPLLLDNIMLICTIIATGQEIKFMILMEIYDENNNAPIFLHLPYSFNVSEATPQGSIIAPEVTAADADPSDAGKLTYSIIVTDQYSDYFNFTIPSSGKLALTKELNSDLVKNISLTVQVKDNSYNESVLGILQPQHVRRTLVLINIIPILGELEMINTAYSLKISNLDQDVTIDPSFQNKPALEFSLISTEINDDWKYFRITQNNLLHVETNLTKTHCTLFLKVKRRFKSVFVVSFIFVDILRPTIFRQPEINLILAENTLVGTYVTKLETMNQRGETKFYFLDNGTGTEFFSLDQTKGIITIKKDLRTIQRKEINIKVGLSNSPSMNVSDTTQLKLTISTIIDSTPRFARNIYEFSPFNSTVIGQVQAKGSLSSIPIAYRLLDNYRQFSIDHSGTIYCEDCSSIDDDTISLVAIAEAETPYNRSDSALVLIHQPLKSFSTPNWLVAFIISIILAVIFLITITIFIALIYVASKKLNEKENKQSQHGCETLEDNDYKTLNKRDSVLRSIKKAFQDPKSRRQDRLSASEVKSVSSDVPQMETSSTKILVHRESTPSESSSLERLGPCPSSLGSVCRRQDRMDWASSQDTINASNMTITRPAVGTNGITLYY